MSWMLEMFTPEEVVKQLDDLLAGFAEFAEDTLSEALEPPHPGAVDSAKPLAFVNELTLPEARLLILGLYSLATSMAFASQNIPWLLDAIKSLGSEPLNRDEMLGLFRQLGDDAPDSSF